ncbi:MAG: hypothetical protein M0P55_15275 [Clostridiales bacterium]|nr:hypothetical protein [Clostridiales bacterium]
MAQFADRIVEFTRMKAAELQDNEGNWRTHPSIQRDAVAGILESVGIVDVLMAYRSQRQGGRLTLLDGHLRKKLDPEQEWPVVITDLTDEEADLILTTHDPLAAMAGVDAEKLRELLDRQVSAVDSLAVQEVFRQLQNAAAEVEAEADKKREKEQAAKDHIPEMDLLPFEHYDYVVLVFKNSLDFEAAIECFGIGKVRYQAESLKGKSAAKIGAARVLDGAEVLKRLWAAEAQAED